MRIHRGFTFYIVFLLPILIGVTRKTLPGQPVAIEAVPAISLLMMICIGLVKFKLTRPSRIEALILAWIALNILYSIPAALIDLALGFQALTLAAAVPMVGIATMRCTTPRDNQYALHAMKLFSICMALQLPIGLYMLAFGNSALPEIFRANAAEIAIGKEFRIGQPMLAGYFSTAPVNSIATLCAFGVALSISVKQRSTKRQIFWFAVTFGLLIVAWLTARRGVFFACVAILITVLVLGAFFSQGKGVRNILVTLAAITVASLFYVDSLGLLLGDRLILLTEGGLDLSSRFHEVFLRFLLYWVEEAAFGNFTGYASGVGKAFDVRDLETQPAEVGAAMIVAEHGLVGLALILWIFAASLTMMIRIIRKNSQFWLLPIVLTYAMLFLLFFFKENSALFPGFIGSLFFWAVPGTVRLLSAVEREYGNV